MYIVYAAYIAIIKLEFYVIYCNNYIKVKRFKFCFIASRIMHQHIIFINLFSLRLLYIFHFCINLYCVYYVLTEKSIKFADIRLFCFNLTFLLLRIIMYAYMVYAIYVLLYSLRSYTFTYIH